MTVPYLKHVDYGTTSRKLFCILRSVLSLRISSYFETLSLPFGVGVCVHL